VETTPTTATAPIPESDSEDEECVPPTQPETKKRRIEPNDLPPALRALANASVSDYDISEPLD
jgi:hypothetical protein